MDQRLDANSIVERVGRPFVIEAVRMLEAGEGTVIGIDDALEAAGYRLGPFGLLDEVGLEADIMVDRALAEAAFDGGTRFGPPPMQERLVSEGRIGRAAGRGFYRYGPGGIVVVEVRGAPATTTLSDDAIVERIELATVNEAYRVVGEGLATAPAIDEAMRGAGQPRGPFEIVDRLGLRAVVVRLRELHQETAGRSGDQFLVAAALWQIATA
jgi:3-hydroxybutyryl-CoA dehydrogenase